METFNPSVGEVSPYALNILYIRRCESFSLPIVSNTLPGDLFRVFYSRLRKKPLSLRRRGLR
jgi:hypothetical protein